jgi:hypothetical protein
LIVVVYVDDLVITGNNTDLILRLKKQLVDSFDMIDLGTLHYFLGLQVLPLCDGFFISQSKYVMDLLTRFKMADCKPCATPFQSGVKLTKTCQTPTVDAAIHQELVDSLIYLTHSQLDISFAVRMVSQFMEDPRESHWKAVKRFVHYLVRFGSSEVLLHRRRPTCGSDRAHFLPSDFIMCFYKVTL